MTKQELEEKLGKITEQYETQKERGININDKMYIRAEKDGIEKTITAIYIETKVTGKDDEEYFGKSVIHTSYGDPIWTYIRFPKGKSASEVSEEIKEKHKKWLDKAKSEVYKTHQPRVSKDFFREHEKQIYPLKSNL